MSEALDKHYERLKELDIPSEQILDFLCRASIARKKAEAMKRLERVEQNGWNDFDKYHYATADDVMEATRRVLGEVGLTIGMTVIDVAERTYKSGKMTMVTMKLEFELTDVDTGAVEVKEIRAQASDRSDKAYYKCYTMGAKYWLKCTFSISTGDGDVESDESVDAAFAEQAKTTKRTKKPDINRSPAARQKRDHDARSRAAELKAWRTNNNKIHGIVGKLPKPWTAAFHGYVKEQLGLDVDYSWNDLSAGQLFKVRKRLEEEDSPLAYVREVSADYLAAPDDVDWNGVSELVHAITGSSAERFQAAARAMCASYGVEKHTELSDEQLQGLWLELASRSTVVPNGGKSGEVSEREMWLQALVDEHQKEADEAA